MKFSLLKKGFCPRNELLQQAVLRGDNWPIVMLGQRVDQMVLPGYFGDNGVVARVLWSSHLGKDVVTALVEAIPEHEPEKEIRIYLCDSPEEVNGEMIFTSRFYTVGLTACDNAVIMTVYAEDLWTPYEALTQ